MINDVTPNLGLPLPHQSNDLSDDVGRVRTALLALDAAVFAKAGPAEITSALNDLVGAAPGALDTLNELAAAIGDDPNFAATLAAQIAAVQAGSMPVGRMAGVAVLGGVKIGANLVIDEFGVLSAPGSGGGSTQTFEVVDLIPTAGQTVFNVTGGYVLGQIEVLLNGIELMADDYTASNGTTVALAAGASVSDVLRVRKWSVFDVALIATQAEAEAGTLNTKVMSPLRVKQAVAALSPPVTEIITPSNVSPAVAATGISDTSTFTGSAFFSLYGAAQSGVQVRISTSTNFTAPLYSSGDQPAGVSFTLPGGILAVSTAYYWGLRYKNSRGIYSEWSSPTSFTTAAQFNSYIPTPAATPASFGEPFEGGFYKGMLWNQLVQSITSTTIGTGSKAFAVADMTSTPLVYAGQTLEVRSRANPANKMIGVVTNAIGTTLTLNVTSVGGSGTFTDWSIMSRYRLIDAPKASGENAGIALKNANTAFPTACQTLTEGWLATLAMVAGGDATVYPAAWWARGLVINGKSDWFIDARDGVELSWRNEKPVTDANYVVADRPVGATPNYMNLGSYGDTANTHGLNNNSAPSGAAYTASNPAQTAAVAFKTGGAEAYTYGTSYYWSCSEYSASDAWFQYWYSSNPGYQNRNSKTYAYRVRAVRRSII